MKTIQFILSILATLAAAGMVYGAVSTTSPMQGINIAFTVVLFAGSLMLVRMSYKEVIND